MSFMPSSYFEENPVWGVVKGEAYALLLVGKFLSHSYSETASSKPGMFCGEKKKRWRVRDATKAKAAG